jgi:hypothetical protein
VHFLAAGGGRRRPAFFGWLPSLHAACPFDVLPLSLVSSPHPPSARLACACAVCPAPWHGHCGPCAVRLTRATPPDQARWPQRRGRKKLAPDSLTCRLPLLRPPRLSRLHAGRRRPGAPGGQGGPPGRAGLPGCAAAGATPAHSHGRAPRRGRLSSVWGTPGRASSAFVDGAAFTQVAQAYRQRLHERSGPRQKKERRPPPLTPPRRPRPVRRPPRARRRAP